MKKEPKDWRTPAMLDFSAALARQEYTSIAEFFESLTNEMKNHVEIENRELSARLAQAASDIHVTAHNFMVAANILRKIQ